MNDLIPARFLAQKKKQSLQRSNQAVAYIRVSDDSQIDGESLDVQKARICKYAEDNNLEIVQWFGDEGVSAKTVNKRDDMLELLKFCTRHKDNIGYVIVYKMQRASREVTTYYAQIEYVLQGLGIVIRSATEYIDETPTGRFIKGVLILNGQLDNEIKSGVTSDNMTSVAKQGWWQHGKLIGYDLIKVKIGSKKYRTTLRRNKDASIVKELYEIFSKGGLAQADIKRIASERGLKNYKGKHLDDNGVHRLLTQPAYAGFICSKHTNFEIYEGKHINEAIVSQEIFNKVQEQINNTSRNRTSKKLDVNNELYPLGKFMLCPSCGRRYYYSSPKTGAGGYSPRYHCPRQQCKGKTPSIKADKANYLFAELLKQIKPSNDTIRLYKEILNRTAVKQLNNINTRIKNLRNVVSDLDSERITAMRRCNNNEISNIEKDEVISAIDVERIEKIGQLEKLESQQALKKTQIDYAMNFMDNAYRLWVDADLDLRRRFQKMLFPEGIYFDSKKLQFGTNNISPPYRYISNKKDLSIAEKSSLVTPAGFEPAIFWMRTRCPGPLDDGASSESTSGFRKQTSLFDFCLLSLLPLNFTNIRYPANWFAKFVNRN